MDRSANNISSTNKSSMRKVIITAVAAMLTAAILTAAGGCGTNRYPVKKQSIDDCQLRVLQFNIQTENGNPAPFETRAGMFRKLVDDLQPDVAGMQEVTTKWREWLDKKVFNKSYAGVGEARTEGGEANPIYYRKDKFKLVDSGTFWLSDTPDEPGSAFEGANYPRICTWVILEGKADRKTVRFAYMNTHLDHNGNNDSAGGNAIRKQQAEVIVRFAAQHFVNMPVFLSGDMNCRRTTSKGNIYAVYQLLTGQASATDAEGNTFTLNLSDSRIDAPVTVPEDRIATMTKYYNESSASYEPTREPIDYVFYDPQRVEALTYETFLISEDGCEISDHLPVFTTFRIKAGYIKAG